MKGDLVPVRPDAIEQRILLIRGQRVMLDRDLAELYGVETKNLNRAVRRNPERFPSDFMFRLTSDEAEASRCQTGTLKQGQNIKYLPYAFTQEFDAIHQLMSPPVPPRKLIGFHVRERRTSYRTTRKSSKTDGLHAKRGDVY